MKKTLVAIAAIAAATGAMAQSSVTVYGIVDAGYYTATTKTNSASQANVTNKYAGLANSTLAGSRLGFKGTEDLGNGLKANFVAEMALNAISDSFATKKDGGGAPAGNATQDSIATTGATAGNTTPFNRQTWIGLDSAKLGEVRLGYMNTLQYDHNAPYSAGFEGAAGAREHLEVLSGASLGAITNAETNRATGVTYFAPAMGGLKLAAQWGALKAIQTEGGTVATAGADAKASHASLSANYSNGPLAVGAVVGESKVQANAAGSVYSGAVPIVTNAYSLGASYDLSVAKLFAYYGERTTTNGTAAQEVNVKVYRVGTQVPVGNFKLFASVGQLKGDQGTKQVSDRITTQVGTLYSFSKRTTGFALYGQDRADQGLDGFSTAAAGSPSAAAALASKTTTSTFRIGLNHSF